LIGYDAKSVRGFEYDPDRAMQLLEEAGYPNGEGFPEIILQISSSGGRNEQVAEAIDKMLEENLNIVVSIHKLPLSQHYENVETGKATFWRAGWRADFPDVESFLTVFNGVHVPADLSERAYLNPVRYQSEEFDSLYRATQETVDEDARFELAQLADQRLIDDAVVMPIYYDRDYRLLQSYVKNLDQNPMEYRNFRSVYFDPTALIK
jgi:peptide/nickel transport system substrate-binding protein